MSYEWATVLVVRHLAGSEEGAVFQRNQWVERIDAEGGEVAMADTRPGDAGGIGLRLFLAGGEGEGE